MVPMGPVVLAGDETLAARPGPHVFGTGRHREGGRATPSSTASRWGHQGGVFSVRVKLPFASRPWARPVWVAWSRDPEGDQAQGTRHQPPAHLAQRLLARVGRWVPARHGIFGGETG